MVAWVATDDPPDLRSHGSRFALFQNPLRCRPLIVLVSPTYVSPCPGGGLTSSDGLGFNHSRTGLSQTAIRVLIATISSFRKGHQVAILTPTITIIGGFAAAGISISGAQGHSTRGMIRRRGVRTCPLGVSLIPFQQGPETPLRRTRAAA